MTQLPILLMISGTKSQALAAARDHHVPIQVLRCTTGETIARADQRYRPEIEAWWTESPRHHGGDLVMWC